MFDVAHVGLAVKDIEKSKDFYVKVLGCKVVSEYEDERLKAVFLKAGHEVLEIIQYLNEGDKQRGEGVVTHIAFKVDDINKASATVKSRGATLLFDAPKTVMNGKKIMFFLGPDGEKLELIQE